MTRTQLLLEPWQLAALRTSAEREGESVSALVRRIVTEHLAGPRRPKGAPRLEDMEGLIEDPGYSARDHDEALYGATARQPAPVGGTYGASPPKRRTATRRRKSA